MKLNPTKCAFGVSVGKLLGFIINNRGIEANPDKIKVVLDMPSPSGIKEVQRLTRRIAFLSRFVSRASDKCQPFFQVQPKSQIRSVYSAHKASAPEAQQLSLTSSTTLHRPCSLRVRLAQAIQPTRPQRPEPSSSV